MAFANHAFKTMLPTMPADPNNPAIIPALEIVFVDFNHSSETSFHEVVPASMEGTIKLAFAINISTSSHYTFPINSPQSS